MYLYSFSNFLSTILRHDEINLKIFKEIISFSLSIPFYGCHDIMIYPD